MQLERVRMHQKTIGIASEGALTIRSITVLAQGASLARDGAALLEVRSESRKHVFLVL